MEYKSPSKVYLYSHIPLYLSIFRLRCGWYIDFKFTIYYLIREWQCKRLLSALHMFHVISTCNSYRYDASNGYRGEQQSCIVRAIRLLLALIRPLLPSPTEPPFRVLRRLPKTTGYYQSNIIQLNKSIYNGALSTFNRAAGRRNTRGDSIGSRERAVKLPGLESAC